MKNLIDLPPTLAKSTVDTGWYYAPETKPERQFAFGSIIVVDKN
jgi:hypothetical protein